MTGFGTFDESSARDRFIVTRAFSTMIPGLTEKVTLASAQPSDQQVWLDGLVEQHGDILNGTSIRGAGPNVTNMGWMVLFDADDAHEPRAELVYSQRTDDLGASMRAARARFLGRTIETALYEAFKPLHPDDPPFEIALYSDGAYAAQTLITDGARLLDAAATFHRRADTLVRWHGGATETALLRYGPLSLVNLNYRAKP